MVETTLSVMVRDSQNNTRRSEFNQDGPTHLPQDA